MRAKAGVTLLSILHERTVEGIDTVGEDAGVGAATIQASMSPCLHVEDQGRDVDGEE